MRYTLLMGRISAILVLPLGGFVILINPRKEVVLGRGDNQKRKQNHKHGYRPPAFRWSRFPAFVLSHLASRCALVILE